MSTFAALPSGLLREPRPRDFAARFARAKLATVGQRVRRSHRGRHALVLLAAVAVPAIAAPGDWNAFDIAPAGGRLRLLDPMPFEKPSDSFPGSAFYYLANDDEYYLAPGRLGDGVHSDADDGAMLDPLAGPAARSLMVDNSGVDRSRALECLTAAIYYEAASEPDAGQRAVAQVVLNRVAHPAYPNTVCGVVYQGSERSTGCQFSFTCDGSLARKPARLFWDRARSVAQTALSGYVYTPVGLATHYHTIAVHPGWSDRLTHIGTIGAHRFYKFGGAAGQPGAFRFAYLGGEPLPVPHARNAAADAAADHFLDPFEVERAFEAGLKTAQPAGTPAAPSRSAPAYSSEQQQRGGDAIYRGQNLPDASGIRPEYQNSGKWITQPTT